MSTPFLGEIKIISWNFPTKGWAFCNGQLLPINQNQALFSLQAQASLAKIERRSSTEERRSSCSVTRSHAVVCLVRPLKLHGIRAHRFGLPGADVADLPVLIVVPALPWDRIGNRLA